MAHLPPGVVWLASYPKSGNTWMRLLLANWLAAAAPDDEGRPQDINAIGLPQRPATLRSLIERHALVDTTLLTMAEIDRLRPGVHDAEAAECDGFTLVKTHDAYRYLPCGTPLLGRAGRAALYLVRDPRDVAVSFAFHIDRPIDATIRVLNNPDGIGHADHAHVAQRTRDWSGHVASWLDQTDLPVKMVRYEDLRADTARVFADILDFLGADGTAADIERAVRHADFRELKRQESEKGFRERASTAPFFREGRVGGWLDHLSPEQALAIETCHGAMMRRLGYLDSTTD